MNKILLINNPNHQGIWAVGEAYKKAFEHFGVDFNYMGLKSSPRQHNDSINISIRAAISSNRYTSVVMIQPTYLYADTYNYLKSKTKDIKFYSINTEDPYSVYGIMQMASMFSIIYTNEKSCAEMFKGMRFKYLPVAFDTFQQYKKHDKKEYDIAMICSYYGNRAKYCDKLGRIEIKKFIGGNIAYLANSDMPVDISNFSVAPGLIDRHKELEYYSMSKFVINPHRDTSIIGKTDFMVPQKNCRELCKTAFSPNPRYFDAIAAGSIPLCDRDECINIIRKYADTDLTFKLPSHMEIDSIKNIINKWSKYKKVINAIKEDFFKNESYLARANIVLTDIT